MVALSYQIEPDDQAAFPFPRGPFRMNVITGHDRLLPALEKAIMGRQAGDTITVDVPPDELFGEVEQDRVRRLSLDQVVDPQMLKPGSIHHIMDPGSKLKPFRVVSVEGDQVVADFNHPLAGRPVLFRVTIEKIRWATLDEIKKIREED